MIGKRELTIDDYLAILRRRSLVILVPAIIAALISLGVSYSFPTLYTSEAVILVEGQKVPEGFVTPVTGEELSQRIDTAQARVLSHNRLAPLITRYGLQRSRFGEQSLEDALDGMRANISVSALETNLANTPSRRRAGRPPADLTGFYIKYTTSNALIAQQVCNELASMFVEEDLKARQEAAQGTTEFLSSQVSQAKRALDEQDTKMAAFKRRYLGQLPENQTNNLKILEGLNSELDATTQALSRAQQDKAYAESVLAQSLADLKSSQSNADPKVLEQQLSSLQSQLLTLQSHYTSDHPDVIKTKSDISEVQGKIKELDSADQRVDDKSQKAAVTVTPEIQKLRAQVQQDKEAIAQSTAQQSYIEGQIHLYQSRVELSPTVEEQYKILSRDYDTAQKFYGGLLSKKSESAMTTDMERRQEGEQIRLLDAASLPDSPSFPNRVLFAGGGLGAGFALGLGIAMLFELRDSSIRNELDIESCFGLPTLAFIPPLFEESNGNGAISHNGRSKFTTLTMHESRARTEV